mmetsp:Transcript_12461/g.20163  ORF Transcript_12461/g.20163 Transcript_12461/m.20163 type:complete len:99 (+) Transcript_12461:613-909(+)
MKRHLEDRTKHETRKNGCERTGCGVRVEAGKEAWVPPSQTELKAQGMEVVACAVTSKERDWDLTDLCAQRDRYLGVGPEQREFVASRQRLVRKMLMKK